MSVDLVLSPACQLPPKALVALEQATTDEIIADGAFAEMGHLDAVQVLTDATEYARGMLQGLTGSAKALEGPAGNTLVSLEIMLPDKLFLSQVLALRDLLMVEGVQMTPEATGSPDLGTMVDIARKRFLERAQEWKKGAGYRDHGFRVLKGDLDALYPQAAVPATELPPDPAQDPDLFAVFVALPLFGPFLVKDEDCFVAPRLE